MTPVQFTSGGATLTGDLHLPPEASRPLPALVVTGAWMTVRQQMAQRYAQNMAAQGFAALTFDFRGWGESEGERRQFEDPRSKIDDIKAAVAFLATQPQVDPARIGGLGICASSGYMAHAAVDTPQLRSLGLAAPWLHDRVLVEQTYDGADGVAKLIATGRSAEDEYRRTGRQVLVPAASMTDDSAIMFQAPYYTEAERGMIPEWRNEADVAFWEGWLTFDAIAVAPQVKQRFHMVHSEAAAVPAGAHRFYEALAAERKSESWLQDVTQFDFYDHRSADAAADLAAHFERTL